MACRKISLTCGIHCCPNFYIYFIRPVSIYCEERVTFENHLFKEEVVAAPITPTFSYLLHSSRRNLLEV